MAYFRRQYLKGLPNLGIPAIEMIFKIQNMLVEL